MNIRITAFIICLFFLNLLPIFSQYQDKYNLRIISGTSSFDSLYFGVNPSATMRIDTALGEEFLPPFTPFEALYAVFYIYDSLKNDVGWMDWWSYIDLKPLPVGNESVDDTFEIFNAGTLPNYTIQWQKLSQQVDSAILIDAYTDGAVIFVNMKDSLQVTITNTAIAKFHIRLWYNIIDEVNESNKDKALTVNIFPSPCSDILNIELNDDDIYNISVINELGEKIKEEQIQGNRGYINLDILNQGIYFLKVSNHKGIETIKKFAKIN